MLMLKRPVCGPMVLIVMIDYQSYLPFRPPFRRIPLGETRTSGRQRPPVHR
jgi:hypothetical protein